MKYTVIKGKFNCPHHGEIEWSHYLEKSYFGRLDNNKNCSKVEKENGKYKALIKCPNCVQPYTEYFNPNEVTIEKV